MSSSGDFKDASTDYGPLTQRQAENVADLGVRRAEERINQRVGKAILSKTALAIGTSLLAIFTWLTGWIHIGPPK